MWKHANLCGNGVTFVSAGNGAVKIYIVLTSIIPSAMGIVVRPCVSSKKRQGHHEESENDLTINVMCTDCKSIILWATLVQVFNTVHNV